MKEMKVGYEVVLKIKDDELTSKSVEVGDVGTVYKIKTAGVTPRYLVDFQTENGIRRQWVYPYHIAEHVVIDDFTEKVETVKIMINNIYDSLEIIKHVLRA